MAHYPRGAHVGAVALRAAFPYLHADDLDEAERRAKWVLAHEPDTEALKGLLEDIAWRRQQPPEPPAAQTIGSSGEDEGDDGGVALEEQ